ncbi:hypothetical protein ABH935_001522 [Catenulispora sp. GAS73]|uniref:fibronectin type III domain-containing protein n=1 Tax=Catenulispora sp. GAS73 TaxID=3156269 RepID=UPI0035176D1D
MSFPRHGGYWGAGVATTLVAGLLGLGGHGLTAQNVHTLQGKAWLSNNGNGSVSLVDGYSGRVGAQVGVSGLGHPLQVVDAPDGAVVTDDHGRLVKVANDDFTTSGTITLFGGHITTAAAGSATLYAVDQAAGDIQQLDPAGAGLTPIGPRLHAGSSITSPVVAPDGSLYAAVPANGSVIHVAGGAVSAVGGVGQPTDQLAVVIAGRTPVAVDLTLGTVSRVASGPSAVRVAALPQGHKAVQVTGSDTVDGLLAVVGADDVDAVDAATGAVTTTPLTSAIAPVQAVMRGSSVVIIDSLTHQVLMVDPASGKPPTQLRLPGVQAPDTLTVQDRLVFVNDSQDSSAAVIDGSGNVVPVSKYLPAPKPTPSTPKPTPSSAPPAPTTSRPSGPTGPTGPTGTVPTGNRSTGPRSSTPKPPRPGPPGAPGAPAATAGNASADLGWRAAAPNGSPVTVYHIAWTGSDASTGTLDAPGTALGTTIPSLTNGVQYTFTVVAQNGVGRGPSATSNPVTPSGNVPDAPTGVTAATPNPDGTVTLTWTAPDHAYHVAGYTVWAAGSTVPLVSNVSGTSTTLGAQQNLVVGTPVQFQVSATGTVGAAEGTKSTPSAPVTPYLPPTAPTIGVTSIAANGTSAQITVSCDAACQQGSPPAKYRVALTPAAGGPVVVNATADGSPVTVPLSGLAANTSYTLAVRVTDAAQATGPNGTAPLTTTGPPSVSGVSAGANGLTLSVSANVGRGGLATDCWVTVDGTSINSHSTACGTINVGVSTFNQAYTVHYYAQNAAGQATGQTTVMTGTKAIIADATAAFGTCPAKSQYCGGNSHVLSVAGWNPSNEILFVTQGTTVQALCWENATPADSSTKMGTSTVWIKVSSPANGYMSNLWMLDPNTATNNLPGC